jgi:hypothetical protein
MLAVWVQLQFTGAGAVAMETGPNQSFAERCGRLQHVCNIEAIA